MTRTRIAPWQIIGVLPSGKVVRAIAGGADDDPPFAPQPVPTAPAVPPGYFTAEQLEKARSDERDKLYPKIAKQGEKLTALEAQAAQWKAERDAAAAAEADRVAAEQEAARLAREEELSVRQLLQEKELAWENRFKQIEVERATERATTEKERAFLELQSFIQSRAAQERNDQTIAPELIDLITGNTPEQVEASIADLRNRTALIAANFGAALNAAPAGPPPRGVSSAGYAATGPLDTNLEPNSISPEELRNMPMDEYERLRPRILGRSAQPNSSNGLFG